MTITAPPDRLLACIRCHTALDAGDLRCAVCALPVPVLAHRHYRTVYPQVLRCECCAAALAFVPAARAPCCAFCGATLIIEQPSDPIERPAWRVPFDVSRATAEAALRSWLATRGLFAARALDSEAVVETLTPIYWATWFVSAQATVTWTADSDHDARQSAWAPHAGETALRFDEVCIPASRGLTADECRQLATRYDLLTRLPVDTTPPPDGALESFDVQRSAARQLISRALDEQAAARVRPIVPGLRVRNLHVACLIDSQTTERLALPAWIATYRVRGRRHRVVIHGQRPELVVGRTPLDPWKLAAVVLAVLAAVVLFLLRSR